jgi:hypothetical protein
MYSLNIKTTNRGFVERDFCQTAATSGRQEPRVRERPSLATAALCDVKTVKAMQRAQDVYISRAHRSWLRGQTSTAAR